MTGDGSVVEALVVFGKFGFVLAGGGAGATLKLATVVSM